MADNEGQRHFFLICRYFPQIRGCHQGNTLEVNYSELLSHPEDFTSSGGKKTLGWTVAREPPKFRFLSQNFACFRIMGGRFSVTLLLKADETFRNHAGV
jgi:hypothetical protein